MITDDIRRDGVVYFKVLVKPLVNLIWVAGVVFLLGAAVALWPDAREQRRLVLRLAPARGVTASRSSWAPCWRQRRCCSCACRSSAIRLPTTTGSTLRPSEDARG